MMKTSPANGTVIVARITVHDLVPWAQITNRCRLRS